MGEGFWEHPDWARQNNANDDDDENTGLEFEEIDTVNDWVVKLTFNRVGEAKGLSGNGFFLNLPGVEDRHIILTAAHNLMKDRERSFNLRVIYNNPYEVDPSDPTKVIFAYPAKPGSNPAFIDIEVENTAPNTYICEGYASGSKDPSADYGVICIPRTSPNGPKGFGFSLNLAFKTVFKGTVHVSGFRAPRGDASTEPPKTIRPVTSSGSKMIYHKDHVEYWANTEPGISGSPVWVEYNRFIAAVAIHNQGVDSNNPKTGSRGALLTVELLTQVFNWIDPNLVRTGVQLQARPQPPPKKKRGAPATVPVTSPFDRGLFLSFQNSPSDFGRVRLGSGTKFDYMPGQVDAKGIVSYVFFLAAERKWLKADLSAKAFQNLRLSDKWDRRGCLLQHLQERDCAWMELGIETGEMDANYSPVKMQLRIQGKYIKAYDENRETAEVSFVTCPSTDPFYRFILK